MGPTREQGFLVFRVVGLLWVLSRRGAEGLAGASGWCYDGGIAHQLMGGVYPFVMW